MTDKSQSNNGSSLKTTKLPTPEASPQFIEPIEGAVKTDNDLKSNHLTKIVDDVKINSAFKQLDMDEDFHALEAESKPVGKTSNCKTGNFSTPTGDKECVDLSDGYGAPSKLNYMPSKSPDNLVYSWNNTYKVPSTSNKTTTYSIEMNDRVSKYLSLYSYIRMDLIFKLTCKIPFNSNKRYWISYNSDPSQVGKEFTENNYYSLKGFEWAPSERNEIFVRIPYSYYTHFRQMIDVLQSPHVFGTLNVTDVSSIVGLGTYEPVLTVQCTPSDMKLAVPCFNSLPSEPEWFSEECGKCDQQEQFRLNSFPNPRHPWAKELARNGFMYMQHDHSFCTSCGVKLRCWNHGDMVSKEHDRFCSSICNFKRKQQTTLPLIFRDSYKNWFRPEGFENYHRFERQIDDTALDVSNSVARHEYGAIDQTTTRDNLFFKTSSFSVSQDTTKLILKVPFVKDGILNSELQRFKYFSTMPKIKLKALNIPLNSAKFRITQIPSTDPSTLELNNYRSLPGIEWDIKSEEIILQPFIENVNSVINESKLYNFTYVVEAINVNISAETNPIIDVFVNTSCVQRHCPKLDLPFTEVFQQQINIDEKVVTETKGKTGLIPYDQGTTACVSENWQYLQNFKLDLPVDFVYSTKIIPLDPAVLGYTNGVSWGKYQYFRGDLKFKVQVNSTSTFVNSRTTHPVMVAHVDDPNVLTDNLLNDLKLFPHTITTESGILHVKWRHPNPYMLTDIDYATDPTNVNGYLVFISLGEMTNPISITVEVDTSDVTYNRPRPFQPASGFPQVTLISKSYKPIEPPPPGSETIKPYPIIKEFTYSELEDNKLRLGENVLLLPQVIPLDGILDILDGLDSAVYHYNGAKLQFQKVEEGHYIYNVEQDPEFKSEYDSALDNFKLTVMTLPPDYIFEELDETTNVDMLAAHTLEYEDDIVYRLRLGYNVKYTVPGSLNKGEYELMY